MALFIFNGKWRGPAKNNSRFNGRIHAYFHTYCYIPGFVQKLMWDLQLHNRKQIEITEVTWYSVYDGQICTLLLWWPTLFLVDFITWFKINDLHAYSEVLIKARIIYVFDLGDTNNVSASHPLVRDECIKTLMFFVLGCGLIHVLFSHNFSVTADSCWEMVRLSSTNGSTPNTVGRYYIRIYMKGVNNPSNTN